VQALAPLQRPRVLQVRNARLGLSCTHARASGTHSPPQAPSTQALGQALGALHSPSFPQTWSSVGEMHWVLSGTHAPSQTPSVHTLGHASPSSSHWPSSSQTWG
jgi:hypothetical protein